MKVQIESAVLIQVQIKPPKVSTMPPVMLVVIETQGIAGVQDLARFLGQEVRIAVQSDQMSFADLETGEIDTPEADVEGASEDAKRIMATLSRSTHVAQTR